MIILVTGAQVLGGIGLFVLGISMISDGFRLVAGESLRDILGRWTVSLGRGMVAGAGLTAITQSSSAVTIATIGFVNAGLITLSQSLGVVYGANIGTTMTGWLISIVGFGVKIEAFALPLIGLGALMRLLSGATRIGAVGVALAGFGLFFLGVDVLKETFIEAASSIDLSRWGAASLSDTLLLVVVGAIMTTLTQSSSAALALILTAAAGGLLPLSGAAAMVIGANVGTTSTAVLAVIGATSNARRVAAAHVIFNIVTAIIALSILPPMLWVIEHAEEALGVQESPAMTIAVFHTSFNILGAAVMWPITGHLARFLEGRFRTAEEDDQRPHFLDDTIAQVPTLALGALSRELARVATFATQMFVEALDVSRIPMLGAIARRRTILQALIVAVAAFVARVQRAELPSGISPLLADAVHAATQYADIAALAVDITAQRGSLAGIPPGPVRTAMENLFQEAGVGVRSMTEGGAGGYDSAPSIHAAVQERYTATRNEILRAAVEGQLDVARLESILETLRCIRRGVEQAVKAAAVTTRLSGTAIPD